MARTLIIKNADFSVNKVATVEIEEDVPCTGITLNKSTLAIIHIGDTDTLVATATPLDTTDSIIWSTSDASVATVAGGVITAIKCGSATITATCGSHTATCTIVVTHVATLAFEIGKSLNHDANNDYCSFASGVSRYAIGFSEDATLKIANYYGDSNRRYPVSIPNGANKIEITSPSVKVSGVWLSTTVSASIANNVAKTYTGTDFETALSAVGDRSVNIPDRTTEAYNGMNAVGFRFVTSASGIDMTQNMLDEVVVTFTA